MNEEKEEYIILYYDKNEEYPFTESHNNKEDLIKSLAYMNSKRDCYIINTVYKIEKEYKLTEDGKLIE